MHALKEDFIEDPTSFDDMSDHHHDEPNQAEQLETLSSAFAHISKRITTLAVNIADTSGTVGDVTGKLTDQVASLTQLLDSVEALEGRNQTISTVANETIERASHVHEGLATATNAIEHIFTVASDDIKRMSASTTETIEAFGDIKSELTQVHNYSESIQKISTQTRMLAINAGVMAAHAGSAGKGFGVVAESVSELSDETAAVSANIIKRLGHLEKTIGRLLDHSQKSYDVATEALGRAESTNEEFRKFREFGEEVDNLVTSVSNMADPLAANNEACVRVLNDLRIIDKSSNENFNQLKATSGKFDDLVSFTEDMVLLLEESGVETEDTPIIRDCIENANVVAKIFEDAVASGRLSMDDLFDEQYIKIQGSNPEQVMTRFTAFTDANLVQLQEAFKNTHERVAFCAAVDRNGYLPTHNLIYSQPQGDDPTWNAGNCRNRRIFNDRTGLAAGQNTNPFVMQTYRRDMGGGNFVMMKDLSAPIFVNGRHWGGLRAGVSVG
ncbi:MAG: methyl-accepting chemotaxis protein [Lentilitoribacter sp.]